MPSSRTHNMVFPLTDRVEFTQRFPMISSDVKLLPDRLTPRPTILLLLATSAGVLSPKLLCRSHCIDSL